MPTFASMRNPAVQVGGVYPELQTARSRLAGLPEAGEAARGLYAGIEGAFPRGGVGEFVAPGLERVAGRLEAGGMGPAGEELARGRIRRGIGSMLARIRGDRPGGAGFAAAAGGAGIPEAAASGLAQLEAQKEELAQQGLVQAGQLYGGALPSVMAEQARRRAAFGGILGKISGGIPTSGTVKTASPWT